MKRYTVLVDALVEGVYRSKDNLILLDEKVAKRYVDAGHIELEGAGKKAKAKASGKDDGKE